MDHYRKFDMEPFPPPRPTKGRPKDLKKNEGGEKNISPVFSEINAVLDNEKLAQNARIKLTFKTSKCFKSNRKGNCCCNQVNVSHYVLHFFFFWYKSLVLISCPEYENHRKISKKKQTKNTNNQ